MGLRLFRTCAMVYPEGNQMNKIKLMMLVTGCCGTVLSPEPMDKKVGGAIIVTAGALEAAVVTVGVAELGLVAAAPIVIIGAPIAAGTIVYGRALAASGAIEGGMPSCTIQ